MKRVLIVDDAMFMRTSLRTMLTQNGFEVVGEAGNGEQGVMMYKDLHPDIVTLDITMPVMDGITALKEIKAFDKDANVLMVSAMGQERIVRDAIIVGARGFIVKPFNESTVVAALSKI